MFLGTVILLSMLLLFCDTQHMQMERAMMAWSVISIMMMKGCTVLFTSAFSDNYILFSDLFIYFFMGTSQRHSSGSRLITR